MKASRHPRKKATNAPAAADNRPNASLLGRQAERLRWAQVLEAPVTATHWAAAFHLLAETGLAADAVLATLSTLPSASARPSLFARMAAVQAPNVGPGGPPPLGGSFAAEMRAATNKVSPNTPVSPAPPGPRPQI